MLILEVLLILVDYFLILIGRGYGVLLSVFTAIILMQITIVGILKVSLLLKIYKYLEIYSKYVTTAVIVVSYFIISSNIDKLIFDVDFLIENTFNKWYGPVILCVVSYLFIQSIFGAVVGGDTTQYNAARLFLFRQSESLYPVKNFITYNQLFFPLNSDLFMMWFLRNGKDYGLGLIGFFSYIVILLETFYVSSALNYSDDVSFYAAIFTASLSALILNSTNTKNDIVAASYALSALVFLLSSQEQPEFYMFVFLSLSFGMDVKTSFYPYSLLFVAGASVLYMENIADFLNNIDSHINTENMALFFLGLVVSPLYLFYKNYVNFGSIMGAQGHLKIHSNPDGFKGMLINSTRYFFESIDYMIPLSSKKIGLHIVQDYITNKLNNFSKWLGKSDSLGIAEFWAKWTLFYKQESFCHPDTTWYGPISVLLFYPALVFALYSHELTIVLFSAILAVGYYLFISYKVSWMPWNSRFFMTFFILIVPLLPQFIEVILGTLYFQLLVFVSIVSIVTCILFNARKPILDIKGALGSAWFNTEITRSEYSCKNLGQYQYFKVGDLVSNYVKEGSSVVVICQEYFKSYYLAEKNRTLKLYYITDTSASIEHPSSNILPGLIDNYLEQDSINIDLFSNKYNIEPKYIINLTGRNAVSNYSLTEIYSGSIGNYSNEDRMPVVISEIDFGLIDD